MDKPKIIFICPGGRRSIFSVQLKYLLKILDLDIIYEYHIWDFSWNKEDSDYISELYKIHPKIKIKRSPYDNASRAGEIASKQFAYFLCDYYKLETYSEYIFIKIDDDICFVDIANFEKFVDGRVNSNSFLYSANVINNDYTKQYMFDTIHDNFLNNYATILENNSNKDVEIFSNEKRLSINFVSFFGKDLKYINAEFSNGVGSNDEWRLCHTIPKMLERENEICLYMTVVHYAYGGNIVDKYIQNYADLFEFREK